MFGPLSGVDKFEEAVKYLKRLKEEHNNKKVKEEFKVKSTVVVEDEKKGTWDYYIREKGVFKRSGFTSQDADIILPGKDGAPDTLKKVKYSIPPVPAKDIPENKKNG